MATYNPMYYLDEAANFLKKPVQNVWQNLTAPGNTQGLAYEDQIAALDDRQKLAEQLQAQADQPFNIQSYKGIQAPISGYEGAAKMLSAALAGWEGGGIAGERRAATAAMKKEDAKTLREMGEALAGTPEETVALAPTDPTLGQRNLQDIMSMSGSRQATPDELAAALGGNAPPGRAVMKNMVPGDVSKAAQIGLGNPRFANQGLALLVGETQRRIKQAEDLSDANIENQRKIDAAALVQEGLNRRYTSPTPTDNRTTYEKTLAARNNSQPGSKEYDEYQKQLDKLNYIQQSLNGANIPSGYRPNERGGLEPIPGGPGDLRNTAQGFGQENALRDEYQRGARLFDVTNDAYSKISSVPESPAGDLSMLYNYMKMLDPNSVVRESEFRVAGTARPLLENLGLSWDRINSVWAGNRMTTGQRSDFLKSAKDVYNSALNNQIQRDTQYTDLANSYNLNSDRVVTGSARYKEDPIANGRAAIAAGADRNAVIKRLKDAGIDTKGF